MQMNTLADLSVGDSAKIKGFVPGKTGCRTRLMAMGLTADTRLRVERVAPMGDPVEIRVRNYSLSLRKDEAGTLIVEREYK